MTKIKLIGILFFLVLPTLLIAQQLNAHAELLEASPAPGELLSESPEQILLTFNESLGAGSDIFIFTEGFQYIDDIQVSINNDQLIAKLPPLENNEYNVQWSAISADGHSISGTYAFQIESTSSSDTMFYWLTGLLLIGFLFIGVVFWRQRGKHEIAPNGV